MFRQPLRAAALSSVLLVTPATATDNSSAIRLAVNDWAGQRISTTIMGEVLKAAGFDVAYVETPYQGELDQLADNQLDIAMEIWTTTAGDEFKAAVESGRVVNLGDTGMEAIESWWVPAYVNEKCPGLPDWRAFNACASLFATDATRPKGFYLGGPADWGGFDEERIAALELDFDMKHAATDSELNDALAKAVAAEEPIVLWVYAPHWTSARFEGEWIAFPPFAPECYTDPSWGVNAALTHDCAKPRGPIWKAGSPAFADRERKAADIVRQFHITNDEMSTLDAAVELDGRTVDAVVADWLKDNEQRWTGWIN